MGKCGHCRRHRRTSWIVAAALLVYLAVVFETERVPGRAEMFPFASWSLFSTVPNIEDDYALRVHEVGDEPLGDLIWYEQMRHIFPSASDHQAHMVIRELGVELDRAGGDGMTTEAVRIRGALERAYLGTRRSKDMVYELVARRYDPMVRWRDGSFISQRSLGFFRKGDPRRMLTSEAEADLADAAAGGDLSEDVSEDAGTHSGSAVVEYAERIKQPEASAAGQGTRQ